MLGAMEIAVGVLLALAGLVLVGLVAAFGPARRTGSPPDSRPVESVDDLPDFLEPPPGSVAPGGPADRVATGGSVALWSPVRPATAFPPAVPARTLGALAGLVVLLLVAAVVVASLAGAGARGGGGRGAPPGGAPAGGGARPRVG